VWLRYRGTRTPAPALKWFFAVVLVTWVAMITLQWVRHDAHDYTVWLYPIVVGMLWLKTPNLADVRSGLFVLAWLGTAMLAGTRIAELTGVLPMVPVPQDLVNFEVGEYWLPLSGWLGPEGRWPGPLNGTAYTGMLGAMLLVLAVALWSRWSWVFGFVGAVTVLLTSSRGAFAAVAVGIAVALLFSDEAWLRWLSMRWRLALGALGTLATFGMLLKSSPGLTGRTTFWPDFLHLWASSPVTGVGATGMATGTSATYSAKSAHNLVIDELARNGLLGFGLLLAALVIGTYLAMRPALSRFGGPLALVAAFLTLGVANTPTSWLSPSMLWMFLILPIIWAGSWLAERASTKS
jgi:hypothetical protein